MVYRAAAATCPGKSNTYNSNNFYLNSKSVTEDLSCSQVLLSHKKDQKGIQFYAVSEGAGAEFFSDEGSLIVVKNLLKYHKKLVEENGYDLKHCLNDYLKSTNQMVQERAAETGRRISATLALLCLKNKKVVVCNVGNTRIYHYRGRRLLQISEDQTQAQKMVRLELLTPEKAAVHPKRRKLIQYFGIMPEGTAFEPHFTNAEAEDGDVFVVCSSGFYEYISDAAMQNIIAQNDTPGAMVDALMSEVAQTGFKEDATVLVIQAKETFSETGAAAEVPAGAAAGAVVRTGGGAAAGNHTAAGSSRPAGSAKTGKPRSGAQAARPTSRNAVFVDESEQNLRPGRQQAPRKKSGGFIKSLKAFFGITAADGEGRQSDQIWPALAIFGVCIVFIVILAIFGIQIYKDHKPVATRNPIIDVTPEPGGTATAAPAFSPSPEGPTRVPDTPAPPTQSPDLDTPEPGVPVTGISLNHETLRLIEGAAESLVATISPGNAENRTVTWKSSDEEAVIVDENGSITAVREGSATITVTTEDGGYTAKCVVIVTKPVAVTEVRLNHETLTMQISDSETLTATILPENATNQDITWSSSDERVAVVDNGVVTAVGTGTATITVKTSDGAKTAACIVTVEATPVTGIAIDQETLSLYTGDSAVLNAVVSPENATNKNVRWSSGDESVATVDQSGKVTAVAAGTAVITVQTEDGSHTDTCEVTVTDVVNVTGVSIEGGPSIVLSVGEKLRLIAHPEPENATVESITWSVTQDEAVIRLDSETGEVEGLLSGRQAVVKVEVKTAAATKIAVCTITVN